MEMEILQGVITAVVYANYENGYAVLRVQCQDGQTVTVVGTIPLPVAGEQLMVTGRWISHPTYGKQFEAEFLERLMPQTKAGILAFLSSKMLPGIGPKMAARIVAHFGESTLQIMEQAPERLAEVPGISAKRAKTIGEDFQVKIGVRHLMEFFTLHHLPAELAVKTYKLYGPSTLDLLYDDPYLLMDEELEAPFGAVDQFAIHLGVAGDDPRRVEAGILFELRYNQLSGHSFLPLKKLVPATAQLLSIGEDVVTQAVTRLVECGRLVCDLLADIEIAYLPGMFEAEVYSTQSLLNHMQTTYAPPKNLEKIVETIAKNSGVSYSPQQKQAIMEAATTGLLLVTGGPGTGKSATRSIVK